MMTKVWHGPCHLITEQKVQTKGLSDEVTKKELAMTALRKILIEEEPVVATKVTRAPAAKLYVVNAAEAAEEDRAAPEAAGGTLKNIVLFFAAPFIGLAYILALPIVGVGYLALLALRTAAGFEAVRMAGRALKHVGMVVAAPVLGLAFIVFFPFVGLAGLAWLAARATGGAGAR
jgi:hypothetical protein